MTTYKIADQVNGTFGEAYASYEQAEVALKVEMEQYMENQIQQLELEDEMQDMGGYNPPIIYTREQMEARAIDRMKMFLSIVEA